jgi:hypothetical protein
VSGNVDSDFRHRLDGFGPNVRRLGAGRENLESVSSFVAQQAFRHLAAGGISGAEYQHFSFWHGENQWRVRLHAAQTESMTGTSTKTPTTVANAAPDCGPNSAMAVATASSKKLLAPISAPGAATPRRLPSHVADGGEIHLHHHGRDHEPDQDRNGRVDLAALAEFQAAKGADQGGHELPEGNPRHHRSRHPQGQVSLEKTEALRHAHTLTRA